MAYKQVDYDDLPHIKEVNCLSYLAPDSIYDVFGYGPFKVRIFNTRISTSIAGLLDDDHALLEYTNFLLNVHTLYLRLHNG